MKHAHRVGRSLLQLLGVAALCVCALQVVFVLRVALMAAVDPSSTTFQRSEIWRLLTTRHQVAWSQTWVDYDRIADPLKRAVIASEDAGFLEHTGVEWAAIEKAWSVNQRAQQRAQPSPGRAARPARLRGGSTITQQLAKNLYLSREKSLQRKLRELSYSFLLEATLGKQRILEVYLNIIEWGPGLYGLRPAARHYFDKDPHALSPREIAFLVTLIPGPIKYQGSIRDGEVRQGFDTMVNNLLVKLRSVDALSEEEYQAARAETLLFRGQPPPDPEAPEPPPIGT